MRCISYCTARKYHIPNIASFFKNTRGHQAKLYRDVLHLSFLRKRGDIFCFPQGCVVFWGLHRHEELAFIESLKTFAIDLLEKVEMDAFCFRLGEKTGMYTQDRFNLDVIELEFDDDDISVKLAISYGLTQSIKLASYEESIQKTIQANARIPEELGARGKITLSRRAISKRMGEIFLERSYVNLTSEYLEMPEYFWQFPSLEIYYLMAEKYLDVPRRATALNHKLDVLQEIFDMLNNQLQHRHSSLLEMIIILLILAEIVISLLTILMGKAW
jgi:uncharacterized Rmd1/YagE family protein